MPGRVHDQQLVELQLAAAGLQFLDADRIFVVAERHVVDDAHGGGDEAHFFRQRAPQGLDLVGQLAAVDIVDQRQQAVPQLDLEFVDRQALFDRRFLAGRLAGLFGDMFGLGLGLFQGLALGNVAIHPGKGAGAARHEGEGQERHAGKKPDDQGDARDQTKALRVRGQLAEHRLVGFAVDAGLGHQEAGCDRNDERGDLRNEAVADGQCGVGARGIPEGHARLDDADDDPGRPD